MMLRKRERPETVECFLPIEAPAKARRPGLVFFLLPTIVVLRSLSVLRAG